MKNDADTYFFWSTLKFVIVVFLLILLLEGIGRYEEIILLF